MAETVKIRCQFRLAKKRPIQVTVELQKDFDRAHAGEVIEAKLKQSEHGFWRAVRGRFQWEELHP